MGRRRPRRPDSPRGSTSRRAEALSGAVPSTLIEFSEEMGYAQHGVMHSMFNPFSEPTLAMRQMDVVAWGKFTAGPTAVSKDPVTNGIKVYALNELRRYLTTALRSSTDTVPTEQELVDWFTAVEAVYSNLAAVKLWHDMFYRFDWSPFRRDGLSMPPPEMESIAVALGIMQPSMQINWGLLFDRAASIPCLPNMLRYMDMVYSSHIMNQSDRIVRMYAPFMIDAHSDWDNTGENVRGTVETALGLLETTYAVTGNFLRNYLPYTMGLPTANFVGVDPYKAQMWWNCSIEAVTATVNDCDISSAAGKLAFITKNLAKYPGITENFSTPGNFYHTCLSYGASRFSYQFDTYRNKLTVAEAILLDAYLARDNMPAQDTVRLINVTPLRPGPAYVLDIDAGAHSARGMITRQIKGNSPVALTTSYGLGFVTMMAALSGKRWVPDVSTCLPAHNIANPLVESVSGTAMNWEGYVDKEMTPCLVTEDEYYTIMERVWSQVADYSVLVKLSALAAAGFPKPVHPALVDTFVGRGSV